INVIDFGMDAEDAVNRPKFHHQWLPDTIMIEDDFNKTTALKLKNMGYNLVNIGKIGRTELILLKDGTIHAVADKRGDDDARGF
ncbi:MAG TPA: gamma-glutamyltransferase, partial [Ferruginibacter sp.]|nr:gamma-glutamyltransferase [Ferruginibacter sp.]